MARPVTRIDLNLLRGLHVLLEERNVARAAGRLFITPSAMSKTLHRLREAFGDQLLVRTSTGLAPTPRAEEIAVLLKNAFAYLERLTPIKFDPAQALGRVRFAAPETFSVGVIPALMHSLREEAPGLHIEALSLSNTYLERLAEGRLDFAIYLDQEYPDEYVSHRLFSLEPKIVCRKDHPLTRLSKVTQEEVYKYPVVVFNSLNIKQQQLHTINKLLEQAGLVREVMLETSQLFLALTAIQQSDAVMAVPEHLFLHLNTNDIFANLPSSEIEAFDRLRMDVALIQHERTVDSPLHAWLVAETARLFAEPRGLSQSMEAPRAEAASG